MNAEALETHTVVDLPKLLDPHAPAKKAVMNDPGSLVKALRATGPEKPPTISDIEGAAIEEAETSVMELQRLEDFYTAKIEALEGRRESIRRVKKGEEARLAIFGGG